MKIAVCHPGTQWSTADVFDGLVYGLEAHGIRVIRTTTADVITLALKHRVDTVILVTAIRMGISAVRDIVDAGLPVSVLFTESPYEAEKELEVARRVAGCWTHERTAVAAFRAVNDHVAYLPHAWHPAIHTAEPQPDDAAVHAHDVVFVGSGFRERVTFFNSIDWTGIDLGLYGIWADLGLKPQVQACVRGDAPISNRTAAALYRRAKIGLNLYRRLGTDLKPDQPENWVTAESLNPRAYELAACGTFGLSEYREEHRDMFGYLVPTFIDPADASKEIQRWLVDPRSRGIAVPELPACVVGHSWTDRAGQVLHDLHAWGLVEKPCLTVQ